MEQKQKSGSLQLLGFLKRLKLCAHEQWDLLTRNMKQVSTIHNKCFITQTEDSDVNFKKKIT